MYKSLYIISSSSISRHTHKLWHCNLLYINTFVIVFSTTTTTNNNNNNKCNHSAAQKQMT